jgi:predicted transcriptional regulator
MVLYSIPQTDILNDLQDTDYFVLASILLHNGLSIEELQETLQESFAIIQSSCRNLLGLGLIQKSDIRYVVEPRWYASIEDILVTKRMIYLDL